jgi:hypothetical protein
MAFPDVPHVKKWNAVEIFNASASTYANKFNLNKKYPLPLKQIE